MKHLREYNEGSREEIEPVDCSYISDCFIELLDIPGNSITTNRRNFCYIYLDEPKLEKEPGRYNSYQTFSIDEYIEILYKHTEFYLDVKNSIDKVKIKYPNYEFNTSLKLGVLNITVSDSRL